MNIPLTTFLEYIDRLESERGPANYEWIEWEASNYLLPIDEDLLDWLATAQPNALLSLSTAVTSWSYARLRHQEHNKDAWLILEVIAASRITFPAFDIRYVDPSDWHGPVNGPLITILAALVDGIQEDDYWLYLEEIVHNNLRIAQHIHPDRSAFEKWWKQASNKVVAKYPKSKLKSNSIYGDPVPLSTFIFDENETIGHSFSEQIEAVSSTNRWFLEPL